MNLLAWPVHLTSCLISLPPDVTVLSPRSVVGSPAFDTAHLLLRLWAGSKTFFFRLSKQKDK